MSNFFLSSLILLSTVIGVGVFALPFVLVKSGLAWYIFWSIFWLLTLSLFYLIYLELLLKSGGRVNFPGILANFIKPIFRFVGWLLDIITYGVTLLLYLLVVSEFIPELIPMNPLLAKIIFSLISFVFVVFNLKIFSRLEAFLGILIIFLTLYFAYFGFTQGTFLSISFDNKPLAAYGPLFFALSGISAVPVMYDLLKDKKKFFITTSLTYFIIVIIYFLFALGIVYLTSGNVDEMSLVTLKKYLKPQVFNLSIVLLLINIFTTFIEMLYYLKRGLQNEFNFSSSLSNIFILFFIIFLSFLPKFHFLSLIEFLGNFSLSLETLFLSYIYLKLPREKVAIPKIVIIFLSVFILIGFIHGIIK